MSFGRINNPGKLYKLKKALKFLFKYGFLGGIVLIVMCFAILNYNLPSIEQLKSSSLSESTQILDREGNLLYTIHGEENREYTELANISKHVANATISIEDQNFYHHSGYDLIGIFRAVYRNVFKGKRREGASTITQQLIKNTLLTPERTYTRKLKELILSTKLENALTKDQILELYLNKIPYGNNAYGIQKAAKIYFSLDAKDLTIAQASTLAALPNAPSYYSPFGNHRFSKLYKTFTEQELNTRNINSESDLEKSEISRGLIGATVELSNGKEIYIKGRVDLVLNIMKDQEMISEEEKQEAINDTHNEDFFQKGYSANIKYPHFVLWIKDLLEEKYGKETVENGGLKVTTTINPKMQDSAEQIIEKYTLTNKESYNANNAALVALNPITGEVLSMVGSSNFFDEEIDGQVNMVFALKQPGSSFKPFSYIAAFENRFSPASIIYDVETELGNNKPQNYDGEFLGPISLRKALAKSRNIPAIKTYFLGGRTKAIIEIANNMGITTLNPTGDYGWTLSLGTAEVKLIDMVRAYTAFPNNGKVAEVNPILRIETNSGKILEEIEAKPELESVINPQTAYLITNILSDKSVSVGPKMHITGHPSGAKTGTSTKKPKNPNNLPEDELEPIASNLWTIGFSKTLVAGVWAGNANDKESGDLKGLANGYDAAGPIWNEFMSTALADLPPEPFEVPNGIRKVEVSSLSGLLPGPQTKQEDIVEEYFANFAIPNEIEDIHKQATIEGFSQTLWQPGCSDYYKKTDFFQVHKSISADFAYLFQEGIDKWVEENNINALPTKTCTLETPGQWPSISISSDSIIDTLEPGRLKIEVKASPNTVKVEYYLGQQLLASSDEAPFSSTIRVRRNSGLGGKTYNFTVRAINKNGYIDQDSFEVLFLK